MYVFEGVFVCICVYVRNEDVCISVCVFQNVGVCMIVCVYKCVLVCECFDREDMCMCECLCVYV